ncbi:MAG: protease inhibitor I42 family protein [Thermoplasmata archaeon]|nr:protease inhibitor I42 family protein [Thermoplasmata archaeon]
MVSMIFQNVAAEYYTFTIEDNNQNVILYSEDKLIVSLNQGGGSYSWDYTSSNPSVLKLISEELWAPTNPVNPGGSVFLNITFEGAEKGTTTLKFIYWQDWVGNDSIIETLFLNVTSNVSRSMELMLLYTVFFCIIVVPSAIIIIKMKGEKNNGN